MLLHQLTIRSLGFFILNLNSIFKLTLIMLMKSVFCCAWICLALLLLLFEYCNTCTRPLLEKEVMNIQITFDVSFYELQQVSACLSQNRSLQNIRRICFNWLYAYYSSHHKALQFFFIFFPFAFMPQSHIFRQTMFSITTMDISNMFSILFYFLFTFRFDC